MIYRGFWAIFMWKFNNTKFFLIRNIILISVLSLLNCFFFSSQYNLLIFFLKSSTFQWSFLEWINYFLGFCFIPFLLTFGYSAFSHDEDSFFLNFLTMLSLEFLLGSFGYGGGISNCVYFNFGFKFSFILFLVFFIFLWILVLFKVLISHKDSGKAKRKVKEDFSFSKKLFHLPNKNLISIGKKIDVKINIEEQKILLVKTLSEFGVEAKIVDVFVGPVVTLYSIELAPGIKSVRVINLVEDIARSMEAFSVRIASIPGKNLLGVEISNDQRQIVYFKEGLVSDKYDSFDGNLPLYLGCNIYGEHEVFDLSTMPHLLVAGTTGSGKSVGIHTMLLSLLFKIGFEDLKLILIDPKKLELTPYDDIPHLLFPVVTDAKEAISAVKWAVKEMESRYQAMSKIGVRNIISYNSKVSDFKDGEEGFERFPYIVIVIDEMADLMLLAGKELELSVQRLAQMGRAAGVHMIIATQRPSVDVITGTIKANFPTRISFKLSSKIDSRTILGDMSGAEQLLGSGDMLYLGNNGKVLRVHGSYVSEDDVHLIVDFLKTQASPKYLDLGSVLFEDSSNTDSFRSEDDDPLYAEAVELIHREKKVSTSFLQRCFPIGYNRAAKLIERMEKEGLISSGDSFGRNREILR